MIEALPAAIDHTPPAPRGPLAERAEALRRDAARSLELAQAALSAGDVASARAAATVVLALAERSRGLSEPSRAGVEAAVVEALRVLTIATVRGARLDAARLDAARLDAGRLPLIASQGGRTTDVGPYAGAASGLVAVGALREPGVAR
jgi:hypothetical protein